MQYCNCWTGDGLRELPVDGQEGVGTITGACRLGGSQSEISLDEVLSSELRCQSSAVLFAAIAVQAEQEVS